MRITNIDKVVEARRSIEFCGEYITGPSGISKKVKVWSCQVPCQLYGFLNGEGSSSGSKYVKDDRCNAQCPYHDCDSYLPF